MANYYTRTVITEPVYLTDELVGVLHARGAQTDPTGEAETVLDGIIHERMPVRQYAVVFEDGWTEPCEDVDEFLVEYAHFTDEQIEKLSEDFKELVVADETDILHEIMKLNPRLEQIEMQSSWSCSKMRLDGFGGSALIVNKKGYLYITTSNYEVDEDGIIEAGGAFKFWEPEVVNVAS